MCSVVFDLKVSLIKKTSINDHDDMVSKVVYQMQAGVLLFIHLW